MLEMAEAAKTKIRAETGKSFEEWVKIARTKGPKTRGDLSGWLRKEQGLKQMTAHWVAQTAAGDDVDYGDPEPLVDALYSGQHEALRPVHEAVVDVLVGLGDDVTVTACKTMVPAYRKHVFAELAPSADGVVVQLALGEEKTGGRLEKATGRMPGDRLSHAVVVRGKKDVDGALKGWIAKAYELGAGKIARSTSFEMPADFGRALKASKPATATWGTMTPAMQRDMLSWVTSAKQDETRARRLAICLEKLADGKKRVY
jgi:hypothetical protein